MNGTITEQDALDDLKRVMDLLGRYPSYEDMRTHGVYGPRTYQRKLGPTWTDVKRKVGWEEISETFDESSVSDQDAAWVAGMIDGEGCIRIQKPAPKSGGGLSKSYAPVFTMSLRMDDKETIDRVSTILGGRCSLCVDERDSLRTTMKNPAPVYKLNIRDLPTLAYRFIPILEKYPLKSKKKYEYLVFKFVIELLIKKRSVNRSNRSYTDEERSLIDRCYHAMSDMKKYNADHATILKQYNLPITIPWIQ